MSKARILLLTAICSWGALPLAALVLTGSSVSWAQQERRGVPGVAEQRAVVNFSDLARQEASAPPAEIKLKRVHSPMPLPVRAGKAPVRSEDGLVRPLSTVFPVPNSPPPTTNFLGLDDIGTSIPPDTFGAVGPNHLMVTLNTQVRIQDRSGRTISTVLLDSFWASLNNPDTFDPKVLFDPFGQRWIFVACADADLATSAVLIGVSQTADPTGQWNLFRVDADSADLVWADYPSIGFNKDWIVVQLNMFTITPGTFDRSHIYVFNKRDLYAGGQGLYTLLPDASAFVASPAITFDNTLATMYLVQDPFQGNGGVLRLYTVTGPVGGEALNVAGDITIPLAWDTTPPNADFAPQLGSSQRIQVNDSRMHNIVYRNGTLWGAHTVFLPAGGSPTRSSIHWFQVNPTSRAVVQRGLIDDPAGKKFFAFPSIAVNRNEDVMVGYSRFGADQYASGNYSFRSATDPLNVLQADRVFKPGEAPYYKTFGGTQNRWGDYSMTMIDPIDDIGLWTIQEYAAPPASSGSFRDRWGTWWAFLDLSTPPDGIFEITITPPSGNDLRAGTNTPIYVSVSDTLPVINAVVTGHVSGLTNLTFINNGTGPDLAANDNVYSGDLFVPTNINSLAMTVLVAAPGKTSAANIVFYNALMAPLNDDFDRSFKVDSAGVFGSKIITGANKFATMQSGEPAHAGLPTVGASVWWTWAPVSNQSVLIDSTGSSFDTVLGIYTGSSVTNLTPVTSANDVESQRQAYLKFNTVAGTAYRIALAGANTNEMGRIRLRIEPGGQLDTVPPVAAITNIPSGTDVFTNLLQVSGTVVDPEPNASGVRDVLVENLPRQLPLSATVTNGVWSALIPLSPGTNNTIRVLGVDFAGNASRPIALMVRHVFAASTNDLFANAALLTDISGVITGNSSQSSKEQGEPAHAGNPGGKSIWWKWQAPSQGVLVLSTAGSTFDTLLGLYTGDRVTNLTEVASNDDPPPPSGQKFSELTVAVQANQVYRIAVDGYAGQSGEVRLLYAFTSSQVFTLTASNTVEGVAVPSSGSYPGNATVSLTAMPNRYFEFGYWANTNGQVLSAQNPLFLTIQSHTNVVPHFSAHVFTDDFQSGQFTTALWKDVGWRITNFVVTNVTLVTNTGKVVTNKAVSTNYVARSANIGDGHPYATNSLVLVSETPAGLGSFEYRVSSEAGFDRLEFHLNGVLLTNWSGEMGWNTFAFDVPEGSNVLEWRYVKDAAVSEGEDAAFIDNVDLPAVAPPFDPSSLSLAGIVSSSQQIRLRGQPYKPYVVQVSADLKTWKSISTNIANNAGEILFQDAEAAGQALRFYRAFKP